MDDLPLVERIVRTCSEGLSVPVTVKIRIFPDLERTVEYARMLERAGASLIAVHGRLREQKKSQGPDADWDAIKVIAYYPAGCTAMAVHQKSEEGQWHGLMRQAKLRSLRTVRHSVVHSSELGFFSLCHQLCWERQSLCMCACRTRGCH